MGTVHAETKYTQRMGGSEIGVVSSGLELIFAPGLCTVMLQQCQTVGVSFTGETAC